MKVKLRKITLSDTANIVRWRNSDDVRKNLFTQDNLTEEQHINWFHSKIESGSCAQYIIEVEDESGYHDIGTTFIKGIDNKKKEGEFGIFIGEPTFRGKGLSTSATCQMLRIGFEKLNLKSIFLEVFESNIPAICAYKKAGFKMKDKYMKSDKSIINMEILKERWVKNTI